MELLDMGVVVQTPLVLDSLGQAAPADFLQVLEGRIQDPDDEGRGGEYKERVDAARVAEAGDDGLGSKLTTSRGMPINISGAMLKN